MPSPPPALFETEVYQAFQSLPEDLQPLLDLLEPLSKTVASFSGILSDTKGITTQLQQIAAEVTTIEGLLTAVDEVPIVGEATAALQTVMPEITEALDGLTGTMNETIEPIVTTLGAVLSELSVALDILKEFVGDAADFSGDFAKVYGLVGLAETVLHDIASVVGPDALPAPARDLESALGTALKVTNTDLVPLALALGRFSQALKPLNKSLSADLNSVQPALDSVKGDLDSVLSKLEDVTSPLRTLENAIPGGSALTNWIGDGISWLTDKIGALIPSSLKKEVFGPIENDVLNWLNLKPLEDALTAIGVSDLQARQKDVTPDQANQAKSQWQGIEGAFHQANLNPATQSIEQVAAGLLKSVISGPVPAGPQQRHQEGAAS
ncbi:hypothetical protein [Pseudovibrio sp. SPO723]|uniref:hypothetical protein n=1 Tax=Nesiotobacter zosterae TaxID=392721 RepID=UPI0029C38FAA|nr:hypothetical protein [Pseudovibrio sp. SPO723]MDX5593306.1 hypothetical protein [Pseudovibrio sp. SPO723]